MNFQEKLKEVNQSAKDEAKVLKGKESKVKIYSSSKSHVSDTVAKPEFLKSKEKLFLVNAWSDIPGIANASFILSSDTGEPLHRPYAQMDDFIKIDLPGLLPMFWVKVIEVVDEENVTQFTVQPTYDPAERKTKKVTDHFFTDEARSVFRVERRGNEVTAMEMGINETINNEAPEAGNNAAINTVVSEGGWAGFQKYQWKNLTDYLVGITE